MDILQIENVTKRYSAHTALDNVSLAVPRGSIYGLMGPNGAGKTTLIRVITRITLPDEGRVVFDGRTITDEDIYHIGYLPEERGLYKKMKVGEQAIFFARLKGLSRKEAIARLKEWFVRFGIEEWWNRKVEDLSKGMAQKVQFIITVLHRPKLLIFDEPFSGFDPINVQVLTREILRLKDEGATVIFSTHNMASVEELCDRITLINRSHNILTGDVDELRRQFGKNKFTLEFDGNPDELRAALAASCSAVDVIEDARRKHLGAEITLAGDDARRAAIAAANAAVDLIEFKPKMMSMSDIFIKAVEQSNYPTPPEFPTHE